MVRLKIVMNAAAVLLLAGCSNLPDQYGECPQPRFTGTAPAGYLADNNPLASDAAVLAAGERLYLKGAARVSCAQCHGDNGNGMGAMSSMFDPPPRNFTCAKTIRGVPDGQLFWIIRNGSPGTSMPPFDELSDKEIWQIIAYIRDLVNGRQ